MHYHFLLLTSNYRICFWLKNVYTLKEELNDLSHHLKVAFAILLHLI